MTTTKSRLGIVDAIRGATIVLVVFSHVWRGLSAAGVLTNAGWPVVPVDHTVYLVHMPVFALISGTFIPRSVERRGTVQFILNRIITLSYLFLLWTLIQGFAEVTTSSLKNSPTSWVEVFNVLFPVAHLWFLPFILTASIIVSLVRPWENLGRATVTIGTTGVLSFLTWGWIPGFMANEVGPLLVFVVMGSVMGAQHLENTLWHAKKPVLVVVVLLGIGLLMWCGTTPMTVVPTDDVPLRTPLGIGIGMLGSLAGAAALMALMAMLYRTFPLMGDGLAFLGRISLQIYLPHIIATAGIRVLLIRVGIANAEVQLMAGLAAGVGGPVLLHLATRRRAPWLFAPPRWLIASSLRLSGQG